ncbi:MAG: 16S rRNA (adenine(1518)-N(6)/adenine(1519)-N(6))-dimethyltransferase RsmA [Betaproteobacteria bacterium]
MQGHQARKRFGQNFLADTHYVRRIVDAVDARPGDNVVEIGPGLAALTGGLIERAGHINAIEIDRDLATRLRTTYSLAQLTLHEADALTFDYATLGPRLRVVGNLPYNISSPLLFLLAAHDAQLRDLHVMLQKEVVARMTAAPGTADYGRLTIMLQVRFRIERLFLVPPGAFRPSPKVESALARLIPLHDAKPVIADESLFARVVGAAFMQRRKTLRNAVSSLCDSAMIESVGIDPGARGETLAVADFVRLTDAIARH